MYVMDVSKRTNVEKSNITTIQNLQMMSMKWIVNPFLDDFYKDTFLYSIGVK